MPREDSSPIRLRAPTLDEPFHIILVEPEIPPNTGNIARLCAATGAVLHLVGKLGFRIDEHAVRRAGLDYWHLVQVYTHQDLPTAEAAIEAKHGPGQSWFLSGKATRSFFDAPLRRGDRFVFGRESVGLDEALLAERSDQVIGIPTLGAVRSLNVANAAAIVVYEALRATQALKTTFRG